MQSLESLGRLLLIAGAVMAAMGGVLLLAGRGVPWLGRLPGDILVHREGSTLYVPIVTMLLVSVVLTVLLNVVFRLFR